MLSAQAKTISQNCVNCFIFSPLILSSLICPICPSSNRTAGRKEAWERKWKHYDSDGVELAVWTMWRPHGVRSCGRTHKKLSNRERRRWPFTGHNYLFPADPLRVNGCEATSSHEKKAEGTQKNKTENREKPNMSVLKRK